MEQKKLTVKQIEAKIASTNQSIEKLTKELGAKKESLKSLKDSLKAAKAEAAEIAKAQKTKIVKPKKAE